MTPILGTEDNPLPGQQFEQLQNRGQNEFKGLETFDLPKMVNDVQYNSDEFTAVCPITGQPDMYQVEIDLIGSDLGIESKSLKLYLGTYRNKGAFCEALAEQILVDVLNAVSTDAGPEQAGVAVVQKRRGGIGIQANARWFRG